MLKINKKLLLKIIVVILMILAVGLMMSNRSFAWDMELEKYEDAKGGRAGNAATNVMAAIINLTSTGGAGIAIIMLVVIGVQYVSKGAEGKAEAKKDLTGYIVGAIILFGVSGILKLLQMFISSNLNDISE